MWRLAVHGPDDAIETAAAAGGKLIDQRAARVQHLDAQLAVELPRPLVVGDDGARLGILANEGRGAVDPAALRLDALLHRARRHERRVLRQQVWRQAAQRGDVVDDPDAAAVGREHQIAVARLDGEIAHRHRREVSALELRPVRTAVDRDPQAEFGAEEQQLRVDGVFADHVRVAAHAPGIFRGDERGPAPAVVGRHVQVRRHVAEGMAVEGRVRRARRERARLHPVDPAVLRQAADVADHILPVLSAVARQLHVAVVGAYPDEAALERRLADGEDGGVHLGDRVVDRDATGLLLLLLLRIVGRQVRGDALPALTVIPGAEQELGADVQRVRIMR